MQTLILRVVTVDLCQLDCLVRAILLDLHWLAIYVDCHQVELAVFINELLGL